jgi:selenocysteine lyase/cysteine desulfurase
MGSLDLEKVRACFPALSSDQVFFDNAGGSQTLGTVVDRYTIEYIVFSRSWGAKQGLRRIQDYLLHTNVQLGATYAVGRHSTARYSEGYDAAAKYINASRQEIGKP